MAEQLYAMTARSAERFRQMLADGGQAGGGGTPGTAQRGTVWVKVTGAVGGDGWYPGVVSLDDRGTFSDLATAVKVQAADGSALTSGTRYLCTRTGDDGDTARFRATQAGITGSGTEHYLPAWGVGGSSLGDSTIYRAGNDYYFVAGVGRLFAGDPAGANRDAWFGDDSYGPGVYWGWTHHVTPTNGAPYLGLDALVGNGAGYFTLIGAAYRITLAGTTYTGQSATVAGLTFAGGMFAGGTFTGLVDPGDGLAGGTYS